MKQQHPAPEGDTRSRVWVATVGIPGDTVIVQHAAVILPGEELTETPETWELTWDEWLELHEVNYGLTVKGEDVAIHGERKAAWRKIRRMANGDAPYSEASVRAAFGAVRRILNDLAEEIEDDN